MGDVFLEILSFLVDDESPGSGLGSPCCPTIAPGVATRSIRLLFQPFLFFFFQ